MSIIDSTYYGSWKHNLLTEAEKDTTLWEVVGTLTCAADIGMEHIKTDIRVKCGVAIVETIGLTTLRGNRRKATIKIKFEPPSASIKHYLFILKQQIVKVQGVHNVSFRMHHKVG